MPTLLSRALLLSAAIGAVSAACTRPDPATTATDPAATSTAPPAAAPVVVTEAPDCLHPFGLYEDAELVYQLTDEKKKPEGQQILKVASITGRPAEKKKSAYTEVLLKSSLYDAGSRLQRNEEFTYLCRNDTVFTDGRLLLDPALLRSFRDRRFAYEPTPLPWPNQPSTGTLPGGGLAIQVSSPSVDIAKVMTIVSDRKLSGPVSVTVPAGTFECYKVESTYEYVTQARVDLARRATKRVTDYYAPGVGLIRTEMRDADGEPDRVAELLRRTPGRR